MTNPNRTRKRISHLLSTLRFDARQRWLLFLRSAAIPSAVRVVCYRLMGARIGKGVKLSYGFIANHPRNLSIDDRTHVNQEVFIDSHAPVHIGTRVLIGWRTTIITGYHDVENPWSETQGKPVSIGDRAWTGAQVMILPGVAVGEGAVLAAGSVVTKSVDPDWVVAGNPARPIRELRVESVSKNRSG
jgi:acetyltransferase-like isoleucine patch superfamily enzyme